MKLFFGKYRGKVVNNIDPQKQGRLQVSVPAVLGTGKLSWAMPCVPYAGTGVGLFLLPADGANVWVEFEGGDLDYPIWSGCFWNEGELPSEALTAEVKLLKTNGSLIELSDVPGEGGIKVETKSPAVSQPLSLTFNAQGIKLTNSVGVVTLNESGIEISLQAQSIQISPNGVSINKGALEVV